MTTARPRFVPTLAVVLIAGSAIISIALGTRNSFGVLVGPLSATHGWAVAGISLAIAVQNLLWGASQAFAAALAEKYGAVWVGIGCALLYAAGLALTAIGGSEAALHLGAGLLIGVALAGTTFGPVLGVVGRAAPPEKRSTALGLASAGGSVGQVLVVALAGVLVVGQGAASTLWILAALALAIIPLSLLLVERRPPAPAAGAAPVQSLGAAVREAWRDPGFRLLTAGFFVCGFQVSFIGVHLPMYLTTCGMPLAIGTTALVVIGLFNTFGSWGCGWLGQRFRPKVVLAWLYLIRGLIILPFVLLPKSEAGTLLFAAAMGLLWLGTVPLTSGLIANVFGTRYMGTLFGIVFFGHQVGSFAGVWAGGLLFDATGSYDLVWYATVATGLLAAVLHMPIDDRPLTARPQPVAA